MHILIDVLISLLLLMNLLSNIFQEKRMTRQILWLRKHLVIWLQRSISISKNRCKRKPRFWFWTNRSHRFQKPQTGVTARTGLTGSETGLTASSPDRSKNPLDDANQSKVEDQDWMVPIITYLRDPGRGAERNIRRVSFKYVLLDNELYRRNAEDLLLKRLDSDQAKVTMGEVHEGICGTHQSAPKMKWLLRRASFYWPTMMADCFKYYKGCEECQNLEICNLFL